MGGAQLQQTLMAKALVQRGYEISMVVADYGQDDGAIWDDIVTYRAYRLDAGLPVLRFIYPRWVEAWRALKRANADVYHVTCSGMLVGLVVLFARRYGRKVIFRAAHDDDCNPNRLLMKYFRDKKLYEYGLRRADLVTTQSKKQEKMMMDYYNIVSLTLPSLVEQTDCVKGFKKRTIPVLWVNYIRSYKRPALFLDLSEKLPDVEMHMIGGLSDGFADLYPDICDRSKKIKNLFFHGQVPYHDVNDYYSQARVLVNTSESEGFSNSYLQAWVRGVPVVTFIDPDGVIEREGLGKCVHDFDEMLDAIRLYVTNENEWACVSKRCQSFMANEFGEEKAMGPFIRAVERITSL
ncbi:MAG: glycosyltransferase family 4 protein [Mariprofundaceae bacterium]|nr:glycosyltransferase family 4 protein [Mariprofundaceae bacterium]